MSSENGDGKLTSKLNCWEFLKCEREPGGRKVAEFGVCPAAEAGAFDGLNNGLAGGRICWAVEDTLCAGPSDTGKIGQKFPQCLKCEFYKAVESEEGRYFNLGIGCMPSHHSSSSE